MSLICERCKKEINFDKDIYVVAKRTTYFHWLCFSRQYAITPQIDVRCTKEELESLK